MTFTDPTEGFTPEQEALKLRVVEQAEDVLIMMTGAVNPRKQTDGFIAQLKELVRKLCSTVFGFPRFPIWTWENAGKIPNGICFNVMGSTYDSIGCIANPQRNALLIHFLADTPEKDLLLLQRFQIMAQNVEGLCYKTFTNSDGIVTNYAILSFNPVAN